MARSTKASSSTIATGSCTPSAPRRVMTTANSSSAGRSASETAGAERQSAIQRGAGAALAGLDRFSGFARRPEAVGETGIVVQNELGRVVGVGERTVFPCEMDWRGSRFDDFFGHFDGRFRRSFLF